VYNFKKNPVPIHLTVCLYDNNDNINRPSIFFNVWMLGKISDFMIILLWLIFVATYYSRISWMCGRGQQTKENKCGY